MFAMLQYPDDISDPINISVFLHKDIFAVVPLPLKGFIIQSFSFIQLIIWSFAMFFRGKLQDVLYLSSEVLFPAAIVHIFPRINPNLWVFVIYIYPFLTFFRPTIYRTSKFACCYID